MPPFRTSYLDDPLSGSGPVDRAVRVAIVVLVQAVHLVRPGRGPSHCCALVPGRQHAWILVSYQVRWWWRGVQGPTDQRLALRSDLLGRSVPAFTAGIPRASFPLDGASVRVSLARDSQSQADNRTSFLTCHRFPFHVVAPAGGARK